MRSMLENCHGIFVFILRGALTFKVMNEIPVTAICRNFHVHVV